MRRYKGLRPEDARDLVTLGLIVAVVVLLAVFFMRSCGVYGRVSVISQGESCLAYLLDPCAVWVYNDM